MASKRDIKKLLKSKKLSGRESAALIIENQVAIMYGKKPTLTQEEIALIKFGLSDRRHERSEYHGYIDTYQLAGYVMRDAHADALEVLWLTENLVDIVNKRLISRINEYKSKDFPEILTHKQFAERYKSLLEASLLELENLEELIELPPDQEGSSSRIDIEAAQEILDLLKAGKLTPRQSNKEAEEQQERLELKLDQACDKLTEEGFSELWHSELYDEAYKAHLKELQALRQALPEADRAAVIEILESAITRGEPPHIAYELEKQLQSIYFQAGDLAQSELFTKRLQKRALQAAERDCVIVEPGASLERLRKFEKRLSTIPMYAPLFDQIEELGGLNLFIESRIALIKRHLKRFYSAKIAIDELSMLLQVDIAPSLKEYELRARAGLESYNRLAGAAPLSFDALIETELPVIDPEKLKPSEKQIEEYRATLNERFGNDWIQFSLEILEEEDPSFDRYKPFIQEA